MMSGKGVAVGAIVGSTLGGVANGLEVVGVGGICSGLGAIVEVGETRNGLGAIVSVGDGGNGS